MSRRIKHLTLTESVVSIIKEKILNGEYLPGERIIESDLAEELEISRGPIREALRQVEFEGFIECQSNRGCSVKSISFIEVKDTYIVRKTLEKLSIKLCQGQFNEQTVQKMEQLVKEMDEASRERNLKRLIDLDEEFHSLIILESGNGKLYEVWSTLKAVNMMIFVSTYSLDLFNSGRQGPAHRKIVETIKSKSEDDIQTIISEHYNDSIDIFELMDRAEEE